MTQHASLSTARWSAFSVDQQILMIANEMHRAGKLTGPGDGDRRRSAYERVLNLTDLTVSVASRPTLRRELLRWRDLVALAYVSGTHTAVGHAAALRVLLSLTPDAYRQVRAGIGCV